MSFGNNERDEIHVRFCGIGGMGVILTSIILGKAAIYDNKNALQTQSYGAEQRGTKVRSDVIVSKLELIRYPTIEKPDILVAFSQEAFDFYFPKTKKDGIILINSDLVQSNETINNLREVPAYELIKELNDKKVINMILLGSLVRITDIVSKNSIIKSIYDTVSEKYKVLNIKAFQKGYDYFQ